MAVSRWAVLKCKFQNDVSDTIADDHYERLFTAAGIGTDGMVDYFRDMSHGRLDLRGSRVFGWYTVPIDHQEYPPYVTDNGVNPARAWLFNACRSAAVAGGADLTGFDGVVVTMNRGTHPVGGDGVDLWGSQGGMTAFCDRYSLNPTALGQEMGHGYGLKHSRLDPLEIDYLDYWDVMSAFGAAHYTQGGAYGAYGPGLNAVNMMLMRWFDESRLWRLTGCHVDTRIRLRPLHRHDLPGILAVSVPDLDRLNKRLILEFRVKKDWDAQVPEAGVLVHREEGGYSYLRTGRWGDHMVQGDVLEYGRPDSPFSPHLRIEVTEIDAERDSCELAIRYACASAMDLVKEIGARFGNQVLGGVPYDGGGAVVLPGGRVVPVGPWDPTLSILQPVAALALAAAMGQGPAWLTVQRSALAAIMDAAQEQLRAIEPYRSPAPPSQSEPPQGGERRGCLGIAF